MIRTFSIFVSSVQKELAAERRAVRDFITQDIFLRRFFPDVLLFEDTPAKDRRPDGVYLSEIGRRDIYLGLFAHEYGGKDAQGISATEREFDHATAKRRERLIFVKGADDSGRDPNMVRLIRKAGDQLTRRRFSDLASLLREVYASLVDFLEDKRALRTVPFDAAPCDGATLRDIDPAKVRAFIEAADAKGRLNLRGARNPSAVLRHLDLFADDVLTQAALFLFGRNPRRLLQKTQLHCAHFHGTQKRKPIASHQVFEGTAFEIIDLALEFVLGKLVRRVGVVTKKASAPIDYEIPIEVIRESLVNGVAHKDYLSSGFVQALVFPDRVEIWNPGELPPGLSMEDLRKPHGPVPRNPLIAEPLFRAGGRSTRYRLLRKLKK